MCFIPHKVRYGNLVPDKLFHSVTICLQAYYRFETHRATCDWIQYIFSGAWEETPGHRQMSEAGVGRKLDPVLPGHLLFHQPQTIVAHVPKSNLFNILIFCSVEITVLKRTMKTVNWPVSQLPKTWNGCCCTKLWRELLVCITSASNDWVTVSYPSILMTQLKNYGTVKHLRKKPLE